MNTLLKDFLQQSMFEAGQSFFLHLGIKLKTETAMSLNLADVLTKSTAAITHLIQSSPETYYLGVIDRDAFNAKVKATTLDEAIENGKKYNGIIIFGVKFNKNQALSRADLANLTRAFNVASQFTPVVVLCQYGNEKKQLLSIAATERGSYMQSWRKNEKIGKVSIIKDIDLDSPHTGHLRILEGMREEHFHNFERLHLKWQEVFNIQKLNEEFYKRLFAWFEWAKETVKFNGNGDKLKDIYTIKIITRLIFIWFLKEKKLISSSLFSYNKLIHILKSVGETESTYYKGILETLFFDTVNQKIEDRFKEYDLKKELIFEDFEQVAKPIFNASPFVNGGLFDSSPAERSEKNQAICKLNIPNFLFFDTSTNKISEKKGIVDILNAYKFTVEENTPVDEVVALEPELLGKIFENLLAAINPETQDAARKETGSYYTPREIVEYMVDESLIEYLERKIFDKEDVGNTVNDGTVSYGQDTLFAEVKKPKLAEKKRTKTDADELANFRTNIKKLLTYTVTPNNDFVKKYQIPIINALEELTILDPAVGSGAFPMGVLQKITLLLQKIDKQNERWLEIVLSRIPKHLKATFKRKLQNENLDYIRKLGIIQNTIYGVDKLAIAVQISKLRFFISLVIEQKTNDNPKDNYGILPLPNLEFKFVAADTLARIPQLYHITPALQQNLDDFEELVQQYFSPEAQTEKVALKAEIKVVTKKIYKIQLSELNKLRKSIETKKVNATAAQKKQYDTTLAQYEDAFDKWGTYDRIFEDEAVDFFEPRYFFPAIKDGRFDIVIGNPPYLRIQGIRKSNDKYADYLAKEYKAATGAFDLYVLFVERGLSLLKDKGVLNYIMPIKWVNASFGEGLRKIVTEKNCMKKMISFEAHQVFNASTYTGLFWLQANSPKFRYNQLQHNLIGAAELDAYLQNLSDEDYNTYNAHELTEEVWVLTNQRIGKVLNLMNKQPLRVEHIFKKIFQGIATSKDSVYFIMDAEEDKDYIQGFSKELETKVILERGIVKPLLKGNQVHRYEHLATKNYVLFPYILKDGEAKLMTLEHIRKNFPHAFNYLIKNEKVLRDREKGKLSEDEFWFRYIYPKNLTLFDKPKLICPYLGFKGQFSYDIKGDFYGNTKCFGLILNSSDNFSYEYYLGLLNSEVFWFFIQNTGTIFRGGYCAFTPEYINSFPIPRASATSASALSTLVTYLLFLKYVEKEKKEVGKYEGQLLRFSSYIEQLINGMVYELYFEEAVKAKKADIIQFMGDLQPLEEVKPKQKTAIMRNLDVIKSTYERLYDLHHPVRNNLLFMKNVEAIAIIEQGQ